MKSCITCGMPLEGSRAGDIGFERPETADAEFGTATATL
jgi:hypothetical protein